MQNLGSDCFRKFVFPMGQFIIKRDLTEYCRDVTFLLPHKFQQSPVIILTVSRSLPSSKASRGSATPVRTMEIESDQP